MQKGKKGFITLVLRVECNRLFFLLSVHLMKLQRGRLFSVYMFAFLGNIFLLMSVLQSSVAF